MDPHQAQHASAARGHREPGARIELGIAAQKLYDFIWDTYCDWYIELTKARLHAGEDAAAQGAAQQRAGAMS